MDASEQNTKQLTLSCTNKNLPGTYEGTTCRQSLAPPGARRARPQQITTQTE